MIWWSNERGILILKSSADLNYSTDYFRVPRIEDPVWSVSSRHRPGCTIRRYACTQSIKTLKIPDSLRRGPYFNIRRKTNAQTRPTSVSQSVRVRVFIKSHSPQR
ncbi:uncharacterized protein LAJ45_07720 [Morchella importuna]|uniref:uncharacterized protein n=1 Tax=Morchella importuna TaxID=1174673 RepID=UPI001E8D6ED0|nr:uncharacterized protein LAJ45_07720 [Morchella importuna]KAH8148268.1 hypothetical protein LAJ45_07720 [Morchella importuna]